MAIEVTVQKTQQTTVAWLPMKGPFSQMGDAFGRLFKWIGEKGYVPAGPPVGVFFSDPAQIPAEDLVWELRCPLGADVAPCGPDEQGLGVKRLEESEFASTLQRGPYEQAVATYAALAAWVVENGYEIVGPPEEVYISDPAKTAPEDILTEVRFPVRKR